MSALTDGAEDSGARGDELEALAAIFGADFELLPRRGCRAATRRK
jgi:hypothetical protein